MTAIALQRLKRPPRREKDLSFQPQVDLDLSFITADRGGP